MLSPEIPPPDRKKYLSIKQQVAWHNPFVRINLDGTIDLTTLGTGRQKITSADLRSVLVGLPTTDWPFGRVVAVQPCAARSTEREQVEKEDKALKEAWSRMRNTMSELAVQITLWPSAD
jgi:hypothetical protein